MLQSIQHDYAFLRYIKDKQGLEKGLKNLWVVKCDIVWILNFKE